MLISYASFTYLNGKKKGSRTYSSWELLFTNCSSDNIRQIIKVAMDIFQSSMYFSRSIELGSEPGSQNNIHGSHEVQSYFK